MKFKNFQLIIDQTTPNKNDIIKIYRQGTKFVKDYYSDWYEIEREFIDNRFLWVYCQYNNSKLYRDVVLDGTRNIEETNPRHKNQVELNKQLFFCYDCKTNIFYIDNLDKRGFVQHYFEDTLGKDVKIKNIYTSVEEFQKSVIAIKQLKFIQIRNIQNSIPNSIFNQQANIFGLDAPERITTQIDYVNTPIEKAKNFIKKLKNERDNGSFESIILVGIDDEKLERNFDFSSVIKSIPIDVPKDENSRYDPVRVKIEFLNSIR